ncbi:MAG: phosphoglycerate dehydrogenase [Chthoniobacterales bacterium]|nr:phosphoglycerate dehydrogenase [Chthoniobacterales bacterium]
MNSISSTKSRPKVLVADPISSKGVEALSEGGELDVVVQLKLSEEELIKVIPEFSGLVVRSQTKVTAPILKAAKALKVIGRAGVGVDNVNVEAATEHGVVVMNAPDGNTISTAEHAFSLILAAARMIPQAHSSMKLGKWDRKQFEGVELHGKTIGILGMGRIGTEVARRALAFGMRVLVYDPYISASKAHALQVEVVEKLDHLLPQADFITVHMPLTKETKYLIGKKEFPFLKKEVRLINAARGGLIDEKSLADFLKENPKALAALDVFEIEPPASDWPLRHLENLILTPHLGASTAEAQEMVGIEIAESIRSALLKGEIRNAVNMPNLDAATLATLAPWINLADRLGTFLAQIAPKRAEKIFIRYSGRIGDQDMKVISRSFLAGLLRHIQGPVVNTVNAPSYLERLGWEILETRQREAGNFTDLMEVTIEGEGKTASVGGTFYGATPRIVMVHGHFVEAHPSGIILLLENKDRPGIVGHIGSLFGESHINIANMSLSRKEAGGRAFLLMNLDSIPESALIERLLSDPDILSAQIIRF